MIEFPDVYRQVHCLYPVDGKAFVGHVIETVQVTTAKQCDIKCYIELHCPLL